MKQYDKYSLYIVSTLNKLKSDGYIIDFKYENQFQYEMMALYILGEKDKLYILNNIFFELISSSVDLNKLKLTILYNYIYNGVIYDADFLQGYEEIKRGYSVGYFGKYADRSELDKDFYKS